MKNLKYFNHNLSCKYEFKKLNGYYVINQIKELLPFHLSSAIVFMYVKNQTLFFAMNHQAKKVELEYKKEMILQWIQIISKKDKHYSFMATINSIKAFIIYKTMIKENEKDILVYEERANGNFKINTTNSKIKSIFEKIKSIIETKSTI